MQGLDSHLGDSHWAGRFLGHIYRIFMLRGDLRSYRGFMLRLHSLAAQPSHEVEKRCKAIDEWFWERRRGLFSSFVLGSILHTGRWAAPVDAKHRVVRLGVAMHLYRARHGSFPETLDALQLRLAS